MPFMTDELWSSPLPLDQVATILNNEFRRLGDDWVFRRASGRFFYVNQSMYSGLMEMWYSQLHGATCLNFSFNAERTARSFPTVITRGDFYAMRSQAVLNRIVDSVTAIPAEYLVISAMLSNIMLLRRTDWRPLGFITADEPFFRSFTSIDGELITLSMDLRGEVIELFYNDYILPFNSLNIRNVMAQYRLSTFEVRENALAGLVVLLSTDALRIAVERFLSGRSSSDAVRYRPLTTVRLLPGTSVEEEGTRGLFASLRSSVHTFFGTISRPNPRNLPRIEMDDLVAAQLMHLPPLNTRLALGLYPIDMEAMSMYPPPPADMLGGVYDGAIMLAEEVAQEENERECADLPIANEGVVKPANVYPPLIKIRKIT